MIEKKFVYFRSSETFNSYLQNNQIKSESIVYVADKNFIYTRGTYFYGDMYHEPINSITDIL